MPTVIISQAVRRKFNKTLSAIGNGLSQKACRSRTSIKCAAEAPQHWAKDGHENNSENEGLSGYLCVKSTITVIRIKPTKHCGTLLVEYQSKNDNRIHKKAFFSQESHSSALLPSLIFSVTFIVTISEKLHINSCRATWVKTKLCLIITFPKLDYLTGFIENNWSYQYLR